MRLGKTSVIGMCLTCGERWEDLDTAMNKGRRHAKKYKHNVKVEVAVAYRYNYTQLTPAGEE